MKWLYSSIIGTAVRMDEAGTVLPHAYVLVEGSKIVSVGDQRPQGFTGRQIDGKGNVLLPAWSTATPMYP